ncbi:hypothetical protein NKG05_22430 [Oerskovia sp. M15]
MRIERDGDLYTASWSKDGENFTQIGDPVSLPGAASVQDIGLFVTAHSTGTSAVEFQDFSFDDDPVDPEEPGTGTPPQCAAQKSDDFDAASINTGRWTVVRTAPGRRSRSRTARRSCPSSRATSTRRSRARSATWASRHPPARGRSRPRSRSRSHGTGSTRVSSCT